MTTVDISEFTDQNNRLAGVSDVQREWSRQNTYWKLRDGMAAFDRSGEPQDLLDSLYRTYGTDKHLTPALKDSLSDLTVRVEAAVSADDYEDLAKCIAAYESLRDEIQGWVSTHRRWEESSHLDADGDTVKDPSRKRRQFPKVECECGQMVATNGVAQYTHRNNRKHDEAIKRRGYELDGTGEAMGDGAF